MNSEALYSLLALFWVCARRRQSPSTRQVIGSSGPDAPHLLCFRSRGSLGECNPSPASPACADRSAVSAPALSSRCLLPAGWHARSTSGCGSTSSGCPQESPGRTCESLKTSVTLSLVTSCSVSLLLCFWSSSDAPLKGKLFSSVWGFLGMTLAVWVQKIYCLYQHVPEEVRKNSRS